MLLFNAPALFAQSGFTLTWDSEVGCLDYNQNHKSVPREDIAENQCLLVCEGSDVNFGLVYDQQVQNVQSIVWTADGVLLEKRDITAAEGRESFALGKYASGTYIVALYKNGQNIGQTVLIKK